MRFSLPSIDCPYYSSQPAEGDGLSSVELDGFVFHLALAANIVQLLLTTSEDILSGIYMNGLANLSSAVEFCEFYLYGL